MSRRNQQRSASVEQNQHGDALADRAHPGRADSRSQVALFGLNAARSLGATRGHRTVDAAPHTAAAASPWRALPEAVRSSQPQPPRPSPPAAGLQLGPTLTERVQPGGRGRTVAAVTAVIGCLIAAVLTIGLMLGVGRTSLDNLPTVTMVVVTVDNSVAYGPVSVTENRDPAYLSERPVRNCRDQGCLVPRTQHLVSGMLVPATCFVQGDPMSNASPEVAGAERNPELASSDLWYWIQLPTGERGYLPVVLLRGSQRGGMGLAKCAQDDPS